MAESGYGKVLLFNEFAGPEIPIPNAVAYGVTAGGCHYFLDQFKVTGKIGIDDAGVVGLAKSSGWVRLTTTNESDEGCAVGTEVCFSPALQGPIALEARVETQSLSARNLWVGFANVNADSNVPPATGATTTVTLVASSLCGFMFDSTLTDGADWHMVFNGGTTTGETDSRNVDANQDAVAAQNQVFRLEIDVDGTARWYVNGELLQTTVNAVDPTVLMSGTVAAYATANTIADVDVDYLAVEANRDWTV